MDARWYGLIELVLVMGGVLAFAVWQLRSTARDQAATLRRKRCERDEPGRADEAPTERV